MRKYLLYLTLKILFYRFEIKTKNLEELARVEKPNYKKTQDLINSFDNLDYNKRKILIIKSHRSSNSSNYFSGSNKYELQIKRIIEESSHDFELFSFNILFDECKNFQILILNFFQLVKIIKYNFLNTNNSIPKTIIVDNPGPTGYLMFLIRLTFPNMKIIKFSHNFDIFHITQKYIYDFKILNFKKKVINFIRMFKSIISEILSVLFTNYNCAISKKDFSNYKKIFFFKEFYYFPYFINDSSIFKIKKTKEIDLLILRKNNKNRGNFVKKLDKNFQHFSEDINCIYLDREDVDLNKIKCIEKMDYFEALSNSKSILILDEWGQGFKTKILDALFHGPIFIKKKFIHQIDSSNSIFDRDLLLGKSVLETIDLSRKNWEKKDIEKINYNLKKICENSLNEIFQNVGIPRKN